METIQQAKEILALLPPRLAAALQAPLAREEVYELRLRKAKPVVLIGRFGTCFVGEQGEEVEPDEALVVTAQEFENIFAALCHYSVYTYKESLNSCFITLPGGGRAGVASSAVVKNGMVSAVKEISSLNFRLARQADSEAENVLAALEKLSAHSAVILGAPCSGKTTLLREICRRLATPHGGTCRTCAVVDERGELAAMHRGVSGFDVGVNCDVLSFFPKAQGIAHALRTLSPEYIIADEIGTVEEAKSVAEGLNCGVRFFLSLHADSLEQARRKPQFQTLLACGGIDAAVILAGEKAPGRVKEIVAL